MKFSEFLGVRFTAFALPMCNYCNLHCGECNMRCNFSIRKDSEFPSRREKWEISIRDIELFCKRFEGIGESDVYRLTGGEPTMVPQEKFYEVIDTLNSHGRNRIWLVTNGYNLMGLDKTYMRKIGGIILDDHGTNHEHVTKCSKYLKEFFRGRVWVQDNSVHYNLEESRYHSSNVGKRCPLWMTVPELYGTCIYPCCNLHRIEDYNKNERITEDLVGAGWTLENSDVASAMSKWDKAVPDYVVDQCLNHCWQPDVSLGKSYKILPKENDIIFKKQNAKR